MRSNVYKSQSSPPTNYGLTLNKSKMEVVKFSSNTISRAESINLVGSPIAVVPQAKCLGYTWNRSLSAKPAVKDNIARQFFALGSTGCYLGHSNPHCHLCCGILRFSHSPPWSWILNEESIKLLENLQAEIGRRILQLSKKHSRLTVLLAMSWPSMKARVLSQKIGFLCRALSSESETIAMIEDTTHSSITGCVQFGTCPTMHGT